MKNRVGSVIEEHLYLDLAHQNEGCYFPLHTSISLFLVAYCDCKALKVFLVPTGSNDDAQMTSMNLPENMEVTVLSKSELPLVSQSCRLPAMVEMRSMFCRAGLAVVSRHIIKKACREDPSKKDVAELLGFKNTCLKACAEVSQWTRLCEINIPLAVESFLQESGDIPLEIYKLEKKLGEPVRVHNDDKIRRQKLQKQLRSGKERAGNSTEALMPGSSQKDEAQGNDQELTDGSLELRAALLKLTVQDLPLVAPREPSHIRKTKWADLPPLEHVFVEGLYFTLTDVVLLPCIHLFLVSVSKKQKEKLLDLPLILRWYRRVQGVPGVLRAASRCGIQFIPFPDMIYTHEDLGQPPTAEPEEINEKVDNQFVGGPRPTMTKLMEHGIEAKFSPHPCPSQTLDWENLPPAVSPVEGIPRR